MMDNVQFRALMKGEIPVFIGLALVVLLALFA